jgi:hypothetical protein
VREVGERRLGRPVGEVQARLPAGVALAAAHLLVDPQVLRDQLHARVAPREVCGLLEIEVLAPRRHPAQLVGRVGLEAVLVQPDPDRRGAGPNPAPALHEVEKVLDARQAREVGVVSRGEGLIGRVARAVRVIGDAVGERGLEAAAAAGGDGAQAGVETAERAQEGQRPRVRVAALEVAAGRRERADEHGGHGIERVDARVGRVDHRAVGVGGRGRAAALAARRLRLDPQREVRLVPEDVLIDARSVALGDRRGELAERRRARPVARVAERRVARSPQRRRPVEHQDRPDAGPREAIDRGVDDAPVVAGIVGVGRIEAGGRAVAPGLGRHARPGDLHAHRVDPHALPFGHRVVGGRAAAEEHAVVVDAGLQESRRRLSGRPRRGDEQQRNAQNR